MIFFLFPNCVSGDDGAGEVGFLQVVNTSSSSGKGESVVGSSSNLWLDSRFGSKDKEKRRAHFYYFFFIFT